MVLQIEWLLIFTITFFIHDVTAQTCQISMNAGPKKAPMVIDITDGQTILLPNTKNGDIQINKGDQVYLACPGTTNNVEGYNSKMVTATCDSGKMFKIDGQQQSTPIDTVDCRQHPMSYADKCAGIQGDLIEVGFQFNNGKNTRMSICFDSHNLRTFWTKMLLYKLSFTCSVDSKNFYKNYFGNVNPDDRYDKHQSRLPAQYKDPNNKLEKGHLVAKCDFLDAASQRMTYYYINTAPQWHSFNGGNWAELEKAVRQKAAKYPDGLHVYTGTHETLRFNSKEITLDSSGKMPVPVYFWKVVIENIGGRGGKGVAFVGVNDPINTHPNICSDVCGQITWLGNFDRKNKKKGIVYCCTVDTLKTVQNIVLPNFDGYNGGLLV